MPRSPSSASARASCSSVRRAAPFTRWARRGVAAAHTSTGAVTASRAARPRTSWPRQTCPWSLATTAKISRLRQSPRCVAPHCTGRSARSPIVPLCAACRRRPALATPSCSRRGWAAVERACVSCAAKRTSPRSGASRAFSLCLSITTHSRAGGWVRSVASCQREAKNSFGDERVLLEKYIERPRHIEFQVTSAVRSPRGVHRGRCGRRFLPT
jgi:hypothetical protein